MSEINIKMKVRKNRDKLGQMLSLCWGLFADLSNQILTAVSVEKQVSTQQGVKDEPLI